MRWNNRVVEFEQIEDDKPLKIREVREVYYDKNNKPLSYGGTFNTVVEVGVEEDERVDFVERLRRAYELPVLKYPDDDGWEPYGLRDNSYIYAPLDRSDTPNVVRVYSYHHDKTTNKYRALVSVGDMTEVQSFESVKDAKAWAAVTARLMGAES